MIDLTNDVDEEEPLSTPSSCLFASEQGSHRLDQGLEGEESTMPDEERDIGLHCRRRYSKCFLGTVELVIWSEGMHLCAFETL